MGVSAERKKIHKANAKNKEKRKKIKRGATGRGYGRQRERGVRIKKPLSGREKKPCTVRCKTKPQGKK